MDQALRLNPADNVGVAKTTLAAGDSALGVALASRVQAGHKFALSAIAAGEPVFKYAQRIGVATQDIQAGQVVHTENLAFEAVAGDYQFATSVAQPPKLPAGLSTHFRGFKRANGQVGTRNFIAIITSVNCSATAARKIAEHFTPERLANFPNVDGVVAFVHGAGCGMADSGEGFDALQRVMWGYARHPNNAGVLMVGLGCEMNQVDWLLEAHGLERGPTFQTLNIQDVAGLRKTVEAGIAKVEAMLPTANLATRENCPVSELSVALQCGGSDAWSGVTANPALGYASDLLVAQGGTAVLAETPEIYGAEHLLTARAVSQQVGQDLIERVKWWEAYVAANGASLDNNPSPGNKRGGLSTILEKSLGAVAKAGTSPLVEVVKYAQVIRQRGFVFMDSPGYDPASVTGQIASGCNLVAFTTGRGSTFGSKPAPCIKIATNTAMYDRMTEDMDVNTGQVISDGTSVEAVGVEIYELLVRVASGEQSLSEAQGLGDHEFVPWQIGATL